MPLTGNDAADAWLVNGSPLTRSSVRFVIVASAREISSPTARVDHIHNED